ncbi:MAG: type II secretion system protein N [Pseudomonadota bacterium]
MRLLSITIVALLILSVALASLPARVITLFVPEGQLLLSGVSGSLLEGRAARAILPTPQGPFHLGELSWSISPLSLLALSPKASVDSTWGDQRLSASVSSSRDEVQLINLDVSLNAAILRQFLPVDVEGRASLLFEELTVTPTSVKSAEGRITWQNAAWHSASSRHRLGSYVALVTSPGEGLIETRVDTLAGPVTVSGGGSGSMDAYEMELLIDSEERMPQELSRALSLVATPEENGYLLRLSGNLN